MKVKLKRKLKESFDNDWVIDVRQILSDPSSSYDAVMSFVRKYCTNVEDSKLENILDYLNSHKSSSINADNLMTTILMIPVWRDKIQRGREVSEKLLNYVTSAFFDGEWSYRYYPYLTKFPELIDGFSEETLRNSMSGLPSLFFEHGSENYTEYNLISVLETILERRPEAKKYKDLFMDSMAPYKNETPGTYGSLYGHQYSLKYYDELFNSDSSDLPF